MLMRFNGRYGPVLIAIENISAIRPRAVALGIVEDTATGETTFSMVGGHEVEVAEPFDEVAKKLGVS